MRRPRLNLATHPLRNRKFFILIVFLLLSAFLLLLAGAGWSFFMYRNKATDTMSEVEKMSRALKEDRREQTRLESLIAEEKISKKTQIDLINRIIHDKSFSWIRFFNHLEELLPGPCYVLSLDPVLNNGRKVRVNLRVASPGLNDLLELVSRLDVQGLGEIRVNNETTWENGYLVWDISYSYEKNI